MTTRTTHDPHKLTDDYFRYIRALREGKESAVGKLIHLWDENGEFEFAGPSPVTGQFKGRHAIHVLYRNRMKACGMPLTLEGGEPVDGKQWVKAVALGAVDTRPERTRTVLAGSTDGAGLSRVVVSWTTTVETDDRRGFAVRGSHSFILREGKIISLKVSMAPKAKAAAGLDLNGLSVTDIGRLALAAWAVV